MAGRRHKSFRSGDLNEELGTLLLKGIAVVAAVPRPEDVGIDAVATLLRESEDGLLIAEDSFYVQLKSASERTICYLAHEVRWLERLKLPFFVGSVRKPDSAIELYAGHGLSRVLIEQPYQSITLCLDEAPESPASTTSRTVSIGPPLLSWSTHDLATSDFGPKAYAILKPYLETEQRNIDYRCIRYAEWMQWETGATPRVTSYSVFQQSDDADEMRQMCRQFTPYFHAIATRAIETKSSDDFALLVKLRDFMRRCGHDPDPRNIYHLLLPALLRRPHDSAR